MAEILIVGVGTRAEQLTLEAVEALRSGARVVLHTAQCGLRDWLERQGIAFESLDGLYDAAEDFDALSRNAAESVWHAAQDGPVVYAVLDVRDRSVQELLVRAGGDIRILPGPPTEGALLAFADGATESYAASDWEDMRLRADRNALIREIVSRELAGEVKLRLMDCYPEETEVRVLKPDGGIAHMQLENLDRLPDSDYDHRTCALVCAQRDLTRLERFGFDDLNRIIHRLRAPGGCAWDRKQTHQSLRTNLVEEAYEAVDAINRGDMDALYDELGDVLLQVVLHAEIAREYGEFDISDVTTAIAHKMIARHRHVFGTAQADTPDKVLSLWQEIKKEERGQSTQAEVLRSVTASLPALMRAEKVQKRAADVGFDWSDAPAAFFKIAEETEELRQAMLAENGVAAEAGDLLFAVVNVIRLLKLDPELLLNAATDKFIRRFDQMEQKILADGRNFSEMPLSEMDRYWNCVKLSGNAGN